LFYQSDVFGTKCDDVQVVRISPSRLTQPVTVSLDPTRPTTLPNKIRPNPTRGWTQSNPTYGWIQTNQIQPNPTHLVGPNQTQSNPIHGWTQPNTTHGSTQPNPIQPDPWMNPTHVNLSVFTCLSACISRKRHV